MATDTIPRADPAATDLDAAFAEAMEGPSLPREPGPPPEVDPAAPHGRDEQGNALAPYGLNKDGSVRRTNAGRRSKDEKPRTGPVQPGQPDKPVTEAKEVSYYEEKLTEFGTQLWFLLGFVLPSDAGAIDQNLQPMAHAWAEGAKEDATVRRAVEWIAKETWLTGIVASTIPFVLMVGANHGRLPERIMPKDKQAAQRDQLAAITEQKRQLVFAQLAEAQGAE